MSEQAVPFVELLAAAFREAPFGISVVSVTGRQITGNACFAGMLGREPSQLEGLELHDVTRPQEMEWNRRWLDELVTGERQFFTTDRVFLLPNRDERTLRVTAWPVVVDGTCVAVMQIVIDVPTRAGLADGRVRKLIENIDNTISLIDADGNLLETSGRYRPILGYPTEFWETRTIFDLLHPDDAARILELRARVLGEPGCLIEERFRVMGIDGGYEPIHVAAVNLLHDPDVNGIVVTSRNIAAEEALVAQLAERTDRAEQEALLRSRLVATVSHELRNPLHAMNGLAELLALADLPEAAATLASTLHRQVASLTSVLDELLDASRLSAAGVEMRTSAVDLHSLVDDVIALMRSMASGRGLDVAATIDPAVPPFVQTDGSRLRQVLSNLLGNAVKFTEQGFVRLSVDLVGPSEIRFRVQDSGRGIHGDDLATVFEPFTSARNAGSGSGAGLGLSIVRLIVAAMDGTIEATSTLGEGSTFEVRLPCVVAEAAEVAVVVPDAETPADGFTVLVVEDNEVNQILAQSQLARLGFPCVVVGSGEAALDLLARPDAPSLVLMDFQLPGIDGQETTRRLRAAEADGAHVVVIGVTASAMAADRDACVAAGMDDFLAKPVGLSALGGMLAKWSPQRPSPPARLTGGLDALDTLADELGDLPMVHRLIDTYLHELDERSERLQGWIEAGDSEGVRRSAHALKSSSALLGLNDLARACAHLEHGTVDGDVEDSPAVRLSILVREARAMLAAWTAAHPVEQP